MLTDHNDAFESRSSLVVATNLYCPVLVYIIACNILRHVRNSHCDIHDWHDQQWLLNTTTHVDMTLDVCCTCRSLLCRITLKIKGTIRRTRVISVIVS
jgi:hypothetical protein